MSTDELKASTGWLLRVRRVDKYWVGLPGPLTAWEFTLPSGRACEMSIK